MGPVEVAAIAAGWSSCYPCHLVTLTAVTTCWNRTSARKLARDLGLERGQYAIIVANDSDDEADAEHITVATETLHGRAVFEAALARVESASIRAWARSTHNRPILVKLAVNILRKDARDAESKLATLILCNAIGL